MEEYMFNLIYSKLMRLAKEFIYKETERLKKNIDFSKNSYCIRNPWCDLARGFCLNKFSEEEVKYCFNLGFVPEQFWDSEFTGYKIPKSGLKSKKKAY